MGVDNLCRCIIRWHSIYFTNIRPKNISSAPAAIIFSLEGVFAAIAAWIILNQILGLDNVIGCVLILFGVLLSQLLPIYESKTKNI